jgi:hypothetical protein
LKFPYQRYEVDPTPTLPGGVVYRPEVPVRVRGPAGTASFLVPVDTGADETLLPRSVAEALGVVLDEARHWQVAGIGGRPIDVVLGKVAFELLARPRPYRWSARIGFAAFAPDDELAILGHRGFLDRFTATFHPRRHELTLTPASSRWAKCNDGWCGSWRSSA